MSALGLDEAHERFLEDLLFEAEASAEPQAAAFFRLYGKLAAESLRPSMKVTVLVGT